MVRWHAWLHPPRVVFFRPNTPYYPPTCCTRPVFRTLCPPQGRALRMVLNSPSNPRHDVSSGGASVTWVRGRLSSYTTMTTAGTIRLRLDRHVFPPKLNINFLHAWRHARPTWRHARPTWRQARPTCRVVFFAVHYIYFVVVFFFWKIMYVSISILKTCTCTLIVCTPKFLIWWRFRCMFFLLYASEVRHTTNEIKIYTELTCKVR